MLSSLSCQALNFLLWSAGKLKWTRATINRKSAAICWHYLRIISLKHSWWNAKVDNLKIHLKELWCHLSEGFSLSWILQPDQAFWDGALPYWPSVRSHRPGRHFKQLETISFSLGWVKQKHWYSMVFVELKKSIKVPLSRSLRMAHYGPKRGKKGEKN